MPVTSKCIPTQQAPEVEIRTWAAQKGANSKIHLAVDAHGVPVRMVITAGPAADCSQASTLTEGIDAKYLLADKGHDTDAIIAQAKEWGMEPVILPRKNRKKRKCDFLFAHIFHHLS